MSLFKIKSKKNFVFDNRTTLDSKHKEIMNNFNSTKELKLQYKEKLNKLQNEYDILDKNIKNELKKQKSIEMNQKYHNKIIKLHELSNKIKLLKNDIKDVKNNNKINNYYLDLANIFSKFYYNNNISTKNYSSYKPSNYNNNNNNISKINSTNFVKITKKFNREQVLDVYLQKFSNSIDENNSDNNINSSNIINNDICNNCKMINSSAIINGCKECKSCGAIEYIISEISKPAYKDKNSEKMYSFSYKKINHFNEWINQIQGK
jgi:hypothetical protein